jgi:hypothetical protein
VLGFAGLYDRWKNPETSDPLISCTIIVTDANELTRPIHDRMPVVLDKTDIGPWLKGEAGTELLRPAAEDRLRMWPVAASARRCAMRGAASMSAAPDKSSNRTPSPITLRRSRAASLRPACLISGSPARLKRSATSSFGCFAGIR